MKYLQGRIRNYEWGSRDAIPALFRLPEGSGPVAEVWLGAHPSAPSIVDAPSSSTIISERELAGDYSKGDGLDLLTYISSDPERVLGADVVRRSGIELPFLLKLIAPAQPLSLQVHPSREQAEIGFERENAMGIPLDAPNRNYKDRNHKPELVFALTNFEAIVGFRSPRRILGVLEGLGTPLTNTLGQLIRERPDAGGVRAAFEYLLREETRPSSDEVAEVVAACAARDDEESPSPRADRIVGVLAANYPGDPGVVASLLLNPVSLKAGEAMFTPAGTVHAYMSGIGVEIMAASDNVLRAGLTPKHMDVPELLEIVDTVAAPPIRIAPERVSPIQSTFYAPVDDFELSIIETRDAATLNRVRGSGPRIVLCLQGASEIQANGERIFLNTGQAAFVDAADGDLHVRGAGLLVQADVP